jgi:hypothetical protein
LTLLLAMGCAGTPVFAPAVPPRGEAAVGRGRVSAEVQEIQLAEQGDDVTVRLVLAAPGGARLIDARLGGAAGPPCAGGTGVDEVTVDQQEVYRAGPADVSGTRHELLLLFPQAPAGGWKQPQLALDLQLAPGEPRASTCLRLTVSGTGGPDWK